MPMGKPAPRSSLFRDGLPAGDRKGPWPGSGEALSGWGTARRGDRATWQRGSSRACPRIRYRVPAVPGRCFPKDPLNPTARLTLDKLLGICQPDVTRLERRVREI